MYGRRSDLDRAGVSRARVDRERTSLLPVQDGQADPQLLRDVVSAVRGYTDRVQRREVGDLPPSGARVRATVDASGVQGRIGLLREELLAVSLSPVPHHRVPALCGIRAGLPEHDSVFRGCLLYTSDAADE